MMTMNKQSGNMYPFVTHTWNPIRGKCPHGCSYCYMKRFNVGELRLDEKCLKDNLGGGNFIFVGSSVDMWADAVPKEWIERVLSVCRKHPENTYLFQSKNPKGFHQEVPNVIFGTTIETNRANNVSNRAPPIADRVDAMELLEGRKMVSIEPIIDFDGDVLANMIRRVMPEFVSIGADSGNNCLAEPNKDNIEWLITELRKFTEVKIKKNLDRLLKETKP